MLEKFLESFQAYDWELYGKEGVANGFWEVMGVDLENIWSDFEI